MTSVSRVSSITDTLDVFGLDGPAINEIRGLEHHGRKSSLGVLAYMNDG
jgi:hypothetical protein